ncbi:MAG TPA: hypothetical protein DEB30_01430 [Candidatus Peribacter riflensis]|uniref:SLH domain-containing protein n=1 Tax=Candidatus Peribacter riflensis TaxID=1735162 RepID=A0A0S1SWZ5_9BACT|nr:MAG: hypothetical protein PeribacterA2_1091 [Candidatus Peribacter riflensis]OGJ77938.1 MAG: hypothetical protein A2398_01430 [Candidatus Peribacteria bacterium RIFOXYB1_FULL_57_12]OGJ79533.1 MAG: hypothetical protein A2412_00175 [Candidatus Peribacteria bacterium RIFOXYC1_FULL_58_8]ALM11549.1 MAG: hypothetical protein PeribacterB2_1093 [Candidatus Peribacter riflensis]ALM12651.1 MAG: hypothetical protein PeribacterC2_1092 [Candidatus Peribacter riflensis]
MSRRLFVLHCLAAFLCVIPSAVAEGAWYAPVLSAFEEAGYIAAGAMVPQAPATRWKFLDLLLRLKGGVVHGPFASVTFDDVSAEDPQYFLFEEGAAQGWVRGVENCIGKHPCFAFPRRAINRAEAAALIVRAFGLQAGGDAPIFSDSRSGAWYEEALRSAASHCVFRGDDAQKTVRPDAILNQAEMLAALARAVQGLSYPNCDVAVATLPPAPAALQIQLPLPPVISAVSSASSSSSVIQTTSSASSPASSSSQSAQQTPQVASPVSSSSASTSSVSSVIATSDPEYTQFLARYNEYVAAFGTSLSATKFSADDTTLRVLNLLKAQMDMIAGYYQYVSIARQRALSAGEKQVAESLRLAIEAAFENIRGIQQ